MALTRQQWDDLQRNLPAEDQKSYEDYLASLSQSATPDSTPAPSTSPAPTEPKPSTGTTPTSNATAGEDDGEWVVHWRSGLRAKKGTALGNLYEKQNAEREERDTAYANKPTEDPGEGYRWVWQERNKTWTRIFFGTGGGTGGGGGTGDGGGTGGGGGGGGTGSSTGSTSTTPTTTGPTLAKDVFKATMALYFGEAELAKGWMDELYNVVSKFYRNGVDVATAFNMALLDSRNNPNLTAFTNRFKGIYALQDLRQAGKPVEVPTIAQYVASQIGMANILKEANLADLATEEFTGELIGKGNSVTTIAEKIAKAYQRIDMAPKAIKDTFSRYYPTVDKTTLARTILLGQKGVDQLVDELAQYEVLAAAEQQGLGAITKKGGLTAERAMEYARAGGTYQSLMPKFGQIARALPDIQKLTGISRVADISQADVEKAVISQSEQELRRLEDISLQEEARFRARAGRAETGLASQRRANRAF